jgi:hypothetical protein
LHKENRRITASSSASLDVEDSCLVVNSDILKERSAFVTSANRLSDDTASIPRRQAVLNLKSHTACNITRFELGGDNEKFLCQLLITQKL